MSAYIAGFICALVLAALVIAWIAYCMFFKERHKSELHHHTISDIQHKHYEFNQKQEEEKKTKDNNKTLAAGIFVLPSRHKQKEEDYNKRPDYPESPVHNMQAGNDKLIEILNDNDKGITFEIDSNAPYHSDV